MDLTPYVDNLRHELAVAADMGGDETRALAERLTSPLESAVRLSLLGALSAAMDEITRELAPGSVDLRLRGLDPEFVVTLPPAEEPHEEVVRPVAQPTAAPAPTVPAEGEEGGTARVNLRLPAHLKTRLEAAASGEGQSVNSWLVRAVSAALDGEAAPARPAVEQRARNGSRQGFTGWVH
jgi:hypothetical protein